ncbi:aspartyl protease family protein At5g10770-like [Wolffia australiana]
MAQISSFYPLGILCLFLLRFGVQADGESTYETVLFSLSSQSLTKLSDISGFRDGVIPGVHRAGPCSAKPARRHGAIKAFAEDNLRVASLQAIASGSFSQENDTLVLGSKLILSARSGAYVASGNYVVSVGFGTPRRTQTVIFDTGSFRNWIQGRPCLVSCYPQAEPVFDPSSSTYRRIGCTDPACLELSDSGCSDTNCVYQEVYGDGSSTTGFLSADTFALTATNVFPNFLFGCGQNNRGLFRAVAGLLGLGRDPYSLNAQVSGVLGNIFSYCIPSSNSTTGFLNIGQHLSCRLGPICYVVIVVSDVVEDIAQSAPSMMAWYRKRDGSDLREASSSKLDRVTGDGDGGLSKLVRATRTSTAEWNQYLGLLCMDRFSRTSKTLKLL